MAKQTFTTGQVLLASQLTSLQQTAMLGGAASNKTASYTLVAADAGTAISMTSTSATTITVNTGLFAAGDTVQITNLGAGVCTITAGTATVNTASSLALAQYESGTLDFTSTSAAIFIKGAGAAASSGFPASTSYTPTITSTGGTPTTVTATGSYSQSGKYVVLNVKVTITNAGTATGSIIFTLPISAKSGSLQSNGAAMEAAATGFMGNVWIVPAGDVTKGNIRKYDFTTFWSSGNEVLATIVYEVA